MIENDHPWLVSTIVDMRLIYQFYTRLSARTYQISGGIQRVNIHMNKTNKNVTKTN